MWNWYIIFWIRYFVEKINKTIWKMQEKLDTSILIDFHVMIEGNVIKLTEEKLQDTTRFLNIRRNNNSKLWICFHRRIRRKCFLWPGNCIVKVVIILYRFARNEFFNGYSSVVGHIVERIRRYRRNRAIFFACRDQRQRKWNRQQARARITKRTSSVLRFFCSTRRRTDSFLNVTMIPRNNVVEEDTRDENVRSYVVINSVDAIRIETAMRKLCNCQLSDWGIVGSKFEPISGMTWHDHIPWTGLTLREIHENGRSSNKIQHPTLCHHNILGTVTNRITNDHWSNGVTWSVGCEAQVPWKFSKEFTLRVWWTAPKQKQIIIKKKKKRNKTIFQSDHTNSNKRDHNWEQLSTLFTIDEFVVAVQKNVTSDPL